MYNIDVQNWCTKLIYKIDIQKLMYKNWWKENWCTEIDAQKLMKRKLIKKTDL